MVVKTIELSLEANHLKEFRSFQNTIVIRFSGSDESKKLNNCYRKKDYATNVLTFSYGMYPQITADILICIPVAEMEAKIRKIQLDQHVAHLIVHGVLHATGYDHRNLTEATEMEQLEVDILGKFDISNPYSKI